MKDWFPVGIAIISALGALAAASISSRAAARSRNAEAQANRLLEQEKRLIASRTDVFENLVELLMLLWDPAQQRSPSPRHSQKVHDLTQRYLHWVQIYGSDDALRASGRMMQATYHGAPGLIFMRLSGDLLTIVRREVGDPTTSATSVDLLATRMNDVYTNREFHAALTDPFEDVCDRYEWVPPWNTV